MLVHSFTGEAEGNPLSDWLVCSAAFLICSEGNQSQRHTVLLLDMRRVLCSQGNCEVGFIVILFISYFCTSFIYPFSLRRLQQRMWLTCVIFNTYITLGGQKHTWGQRRVSRKNFTCLPDFGFSLAANKM